MNIQNPANTAIVEGYHTVPSADATANVRIRDLIGNKEDTASTVVGNTSSLMRYVKGLVTYVVGIWSYVQVEGVDSAANVRMKDPIGNKEDTASTTVGNTSSLMRYVKGLLNQVANVLTNMAAAAADATANVWTSDIVGNKTDTANTTVGNTSSLMRYVKGILSTTKRSIDIQDPTALNSTGDAIYHNVISVSGAWRLYQLKGKVSAGRQLHIRITMDGGTPHHLFTNSQTYEFFPPLYEMLDNTAELGPALDAAPIARAFIAEGGTSLLIEARCDANAGTIDITTYHAE